MLSLLVTEQPRHSDLRWVFLNTTTLEHMLWGLVCCAQHPLCRQGQVRTQPEASSWHLSPAIGGLFLP